MTKVHAYLESARAIMESEQRCKHDVEAMKRIVAMTYEPEAGT